MRYDSTPMTAGPVYTGDPRYSAQPGPVRNDGSLYDDQVGPNRQCDMAGEPFAFRPTNVPTVAQTDPSPLLELHHSTNEVLSKTCETLAALLGSMGMPPPSPAAEAKRADLGDPRGPYTDVVIRNHQTALDAAAMAAMLRRRLVW